ncbi:MAG TPA: nitrous oxide-stimulated promoter family protein [Acetobacteraceae bacterium]|nr:nitrous oxide-stimulated promoter family protein [Acetobacteraceae bacterium]
MSGGATPVESGTDFVRRGREFRTIAAMLRMYCRTHHAPTAAALCPACTELHDYAKRRLERCVFGEAKPTCANCTVHCYKASMRERIRQVMAWAGPRMLWRHPVLAIRHLIDGRRLAPTLARPAPQTTRQSRRAGDGI